jgi:hypothetical protein
MSLIGWGLCSTNALRISTVRIVNIRNYITDIHIASCKCPQYLRIADFHHCIADIHNAYNGYPQFAIVDIHNSNCRYSQCESNVTSATIFIHNDKN